MAREPNPGTIEGDLAQRAQQLQRTPERGRWKARIKLQPQLLATNPRDIGLFGMESREPGQEITLELGKVFGSR